MFLLDIFHSPNKSGHSSYCFHVELLSQSPMIKTASQEVANVNGELAVTPDKVVVGCLDYPGSNEYNLSVVV
jgi:hypothetical protein